VLCQLAAPGLQWNYVSALHDHPQEELYKRHLVYCVRVMSVGCTRIGVEFRSTSILVQPTDITRMQYTKFRLCNPPEDEQVMLETCRGP
jgi:hypothetical protein